MTLEIWGSYKDADDYLMYDHLYKSINDVEIGINEIKSIDNNFASEDIDAILNGFTRIGNYLQEISNNRNVNTFRTEEIINSADYAKAGKFMLISCGHGGVFSHHEKKVLLKHLAKANVIT